MTKPTLSDFISDPYAAMKNGFRPTFLNIGHYLLILVINLKNAVLYIFEPVLGECYLEIFCEFICNFLGVIFRFLWIVFVVYLGFPFNWVRLFLRYRRYCRELDKEVEQ